LGCNSLKDFIKAFNVAIKAIVELLHISKQFQHAQFLDEKFNLHDNELAS